MKLLRFFWSVFKVGAFLLGVMVVLGCVVLTCLMLVMPDGNAIKDKTVLVFDLSTQVTDRPVDEMAGTLSRLLGKSESSIQLRAVTSSLREAARDKRISALYLHGNLVSDGYSSGYAAVREIRQAVLEFRKSGKPVVAYMTNADNRDYYLASAADQILLNPLGVIAFNGLALQGMFFKGAADKYGIEFTPIRHGRFKSAVEPFIREDFSPENREQLALLAQTIWKDIVGSVSESRGIAAQELQELVDTKGLIKAEEAKGQGLVTGIAYAGEALNRLREIAGVADQSEDIPQISISEYAKEVAQKAKENPRGRNHIALVYAEGEIVDGEGQAMSEGVVAGDRVARMLREIRKDKKVKAVVLRVNSPGGSAQASEVILDELRHIAEDRPVVVSMGSVAASGGYYISTAASRIFAEPSTITGSIGVFGLMLNVKKLANDHGVTFDLVKTGALADLGTITRPITEAERDVMTDLIEGIYGQFIGHVARCRNLTTNRVDEIAQGRVWSGTDAMGVGLVDEIGGIDAAIASAAEKAKLPADCAVVEYPAERTWVEMVSEALGEQHPLARADVSVQVGRKITRDLRVVSRFCDPRGIYLRLPFDLDLN
jgi:protease IV